MSEPDWTGLRERWTRAAIAERAERLEWAHPAMERAAAAFWELRNAGWRPAEYYPKGGGMFLAWRPDSPMPYKCKYEGTWPDGQWWAYIDGDVWPDRPVLWRPLPQQIAGTAANNRQ